MSFLALSGQCGGGSERLDLPEPVRRALQQCGNDFCADCRAPNPVCVEVTRAIALCRLCGMEHHMFGKGISQIMDLRNSIDEKVLEALGNSGNNGSNAKLEVNLPPAYRRPYHHDSSKFRKHFLAAKYKRYEFALPEVQAAECKAIPQPYITGEIRYCLLKKGRDRDVWLSRTLELDQEAGVLRYSEKGGERRMIPLANLNVTLAAEQDLDMDTENNALVMIVTFPENSRTKRASESSDAEEISRWPTRSMFFKGFESLNGRDVVEWYVAIRNAKMQYCKAVDAASVTNDFEKMGWMHKQGVKGSHQFRKRWFVVDGHKVRYSESPVDPVPRGEFTLQRGPEYEVIEGISGDTETPFAFTIRRPGRDYHLYASSGSYESWLSLFRKMCLQSARG